MSTKTPAKPHRIGFYSRPSVVRKLDRRSSEGRILGKIIDGLEEELGGADKVTFRQRLIIEATADVVLRLQLAMGRYVRDKGDDREIDRHVCSLQSVLIRNLKALDFDPVQDVGPTLAEYLSAKPAMLANGSG
jgi:hypothetical protein